MTKKLLIIITAGVLALASAASAGTTNITTAPESKACHAGNIAACTKWRVRACRDGNPAACDYDEAQKQGNPSEWCAQRYPNDASQYRFCHNGSPDR